MTEKKEPFISLKDAVVVLSLGAVSIWLFLKGERKDKEEKK